MTARKTTLAPGDRHLRLRVCSNGHPLGPGQHICPKCLETDDEGPEYFETAEGEVVILPELPDRYDDDSDDDPFFEDSDESPSYPE